MRQYNNQQGGGKDRKPRQKKQKKDQEGLIKTMKPAAEKPHGEKKWETEFQGGKEKSTQNKAHDLLPV